MRSKHVPRLPPQPSTSSGGSYGSPPGVPIHGQQEPVDGNGPASATAEQGPGPSGGLPHGLAAPTLAAAVKELTKATEGLSAAEAEDALLTTAQNHKDFAEWLNEALIHIATVREVQDEAKDLRQAMAVSLDEEAARRASEAEEAAARPLSADLLAKRYGGCKLLTALLGVVPGGQLVQEPLVLPLKELLTLERQCRGKWYPGPGTDHYFATMAGDLVKSLRALADLGAGGQQQQPPMGPSAVSGAADAAAPPAELGDAVSGAAPDTSRKRSRSSSVEGAPSTAGVDSSSSKRAALGSSDVATPVDVGAAAAAASSGLGSDQGGSNAQQVAAAGGSSGAGVPAWVPEFTGLVQKQLQELQQQLALPEVRPPIFQLPPGVKEEEDSGSEDDIVVTDIIDRKQSAAQLAASAAAAGPGAPCAAAAAEAELLLE